MVRASWCSRPDDGRRERGKGLGCALCVDQFQPSMTIATNRSMVIIPSRVMEFPNRGRGLLKPAYLPSAIDEVRNAAQAGRTSSDHPASSRNLKRADTATRSANTGTSTPISINRFRQR